VGTGLLGRSTASDMPSGFCRFNYCCSHVGPEGEVFVQMDAQVFNRVGPWDGTK